MAAKKKRKRRRKTGTAIAKKKRGGIRRASSAVGKLGLTKSPKLSAPKLMPTVTVTTALFLGKVLQKLWDIPWVNEQALGLWALSCFMKNRQEALVLVNVATGMQALHLLEEKTTVVNFLLDKVPSIENWIAERG